MATVADDKTATGSWTDRWNGGLRYSAYGCLCYYIDQLDTGFLISRDVLAGGRHPMYVVEQVSNFPFSLCPDIETAKTIVEAMYGLAGYAEKKWG